VPQGPEPDAAIGKIKELMVRAPSDGEFRLSHGRRHHRLMRRDPLLDERDLTEQAALALPARPAGERPVHRALFQALRPELTVATATPMAC
jgi:hypothetical protein